MSVRQHSPKVNDLHKRVTVNLDGRAAREHAGAEGFRVAIARRKPAGIPESFSARGTG
jgi:hypothetical protein